MGKIYYSKDTQNLRIVNEGYLASVCNIFVGVFWGIPEEAK